jgi:hypothetical protein
VSFFSLYQERCRKEIFTKTNYLLHHPRVTECDGKCIEAVPFYGEGDDLSDEEIANNKFFR